MGRSVGLTRYSSRTEGRSTTNETSVQFRLTPKPVDPTYVKKETEPMVMSMTKAACQDCR